MYRFLTSPSGKRGEQRKFFGLLGVGVKSGRYQGKRKMLAETGYPMISLGAWKTSNLPLSLGLPGELRRADNRFTIQNDGVFLVSTARFQNDPVFFESLYQ